MRIVDLRHLYGNQYPVRAAAIDRFLAHHTQGRYPSNEADAVKAIADVNNYHRGLGWPGFSYHAAVWRDLLFLCKNWSHLGYHSAGMDVSPRNGIGDNNDRGVAIVWLGDYSTGPGPDDLELKTMGEAYTLVKSETGKPNLPLLGHGDVWATACPGEWWASGKQRVIDLSAPTATDLAFEPEVVRLINVSGYLSGDVVRIEPRAARIDEANRVRRDDLGMEPINTP